MKLNQYWNLVFYMKSGKYFSVSFESEHETPEEVLEYFTDLERQTANARYVFRGDPYGFICIHLNDVEVLEING